MISTKNQKDAAITIVIVMVALALHQKFVIKEFNTKMEKNRE